MRTGAELDSQRTFSTTLPTSRIPRRSQRWRSRFAQMCVFPSLRSRSQTDLPRSSKIGHPTIIVGAFPAFSSHRLLIVRSQVNNAGIARGKTILDTTPEEFLLTYQVNVLGCHNILREFLPHSASFLPRRSKAVLIFLAAVISIKCVSKRPASDPSDLLPLSQPWPHHDHCELCVVHGDSSAQ